MRYAVQLLGLEQLREAVRYDSPADSTVLWCYQQEQIKWFHSLKAKQELRCQHDNIQYTTKQGKLHTQSRRTGKAAASTQFASRADAGWGPRAEFFTCWQYHRNGLFEQQALQQALIDESLALQRPTQSGV